jgi:hypothetical protein
MAQLQGRTVEEFVADILCEHASKYKWPRMTGIRKFDSGDADIAERAEELLTEAAKRGSWR